MTDGFKKLGVFDDHKNRWEVARGSSAAHSWIELRHLAYDDDMYVQEASIVIPDHVAEQIARMISASVELRLTDEVTQGDMSAETLRILECVRRRDWMGYMFAMREIYSTPECAYAVVGQLARITLSAMTEVIDDESIDGVLQRWLSEAVGVDDVGGEKFDDAEIAALLERQRGRDE